MGADDTPKPSTPSSRLNQISSHLNAPNTKKKQKRPKSQIDALPADYSDVLSQIAKIRTLAATPDPQNRGYVRQKTAGKLWVRERIDALLDKGSFKEIGSVAGKVEWRQTGPMTEEPVSFVPANNIQGFGLLRGRKVIFTADDFSIRAGHADGAVMEKTAYVEKMSTALRLPNIKLVDGSSGGGSVTTIKKAGWSYIPHLSMIKDVMEQLDMGIPNLGAVLGQAVGLGAARAVLCHFSVMAADVGTLFNAGPKVVEGATFEEGLDFRDLGGPMMHCTNGTIDNLAANEEECFEQMRTVLSYLPDCGSQPPPVISCDDPEDREEISLRSIIPRRANRMYNPRTIVKIVIDKDSWFEIGAIWGTTVITGLARLGGRPVGIVANNCEVNGGALDALGSQKLARFLKFCDVFNIPVVQFVDIPGYAIGTVAERTATMRWGIELAKAYYGSSMPLFHVIIRRVYGVAGNVMLDSREPIMKVAWPSGNWGSLPLDGGIEVGHRHELKEAEKVGKKEAMYKELEEDYLRLMNPVRTANAFGVEEIVDPKDTRVICCMWTKRVYDVLMRDRLADRISGKIRPRYV